MARALRSLTRRDIPDYEERLEAARARALYEIGDPSWGSVIIDAFLNPTESTTRLQQELES